MLGATLVTAAAAAVAAVAAPRASDPWIVFSAHPNGAGAQQLFRVRASGTGLGQITKGANPAVEPVFSPSGTRLAFARLGTGIFTVNRDGTGLRRLTTQGRDSYPAWSPDGKRIAFLRLYRNAWRLHTMSATGGDKRLVPHAPPAGRPTWTRDGKGILIPAAGDLVKVDVVTGRVLKYYGVAIDLQTGQTASVSPNQKQIAFIAQRISTGPPDCGESRCQQFGLYLANIPAPHRPHKIENDAGAAGWTADGKSLVYIAKGALTVVPLSGGAGRTISTGKHIADGDAPPAWQPR